MEAEKDTEPAKLEDYVESKMSQSQSLCGQVLGGASGVSGFSESCSGSALVVEENGGGNRTFTRGQSDVGLEGVQNEEEPSAVVAVIEENEFRIGSSGPNEEKEMVVKLHNYSMNNVDGPTMEDGWAVEDSGEIGVEKGVQKEDVENANDGIQWSDVDSSRKIEVSGDCISLIVEGFGPLDGINQHEAGKSSDKQVLSEGYSDQQNTFEINGALSTSDGEEGCAKVLETDNSVLDVNKSSSICDKVNGPNNAAGDDFVNKESTFVVGDLVWAKTKKTQLWWPGVISDLSNVLKGPVDSSRKFSFLVKYFGNANVVWHSYSQLKHFLEEFDQLHRQNNSRNFRGAVERAICEIGRRVKIEMTCPCFPREIERSSFQLDQIQRYSWSENEMGASPASSESQFKPASFLASIKCLAQSTCLPDKIKITTTQNCLSAIYRSLGHCQLPVQQLMLDGTNDIACKGSTMSEKDEGLSKLSKANYCNDEKNSRKLKSRTTEAKIELLLPPKPTENDLLIGQNDWKVDRRSGKGFDSRERRKSKYLSYPFIHPRKGHANMSTPGGNVPGQADERVEMNSKPSQCNGKRSQKSVHKKSSCCFDMWGKGEEIGSSSAEILTELHLAALDCLHTKGWKHSGSVGSFLYGFRRFAFINTEIAGEHSGRPKEGTRMSSNYGPEGSNGLHAVRHISSSSVPKKRQKSNDDKTSVGTVFPSAIENATSGSEVTKCQKVGSHTPKSEKVPKKRKKAGVNLGMPEKKPAPELPDLNRNIPASSDNQATESTSFCHALKFGRERSHTQTAGLLDPGRNNIKFVQLLKDVQSMGPNFLNSMPQHNCLKGETPFTSEFMKRQSEANRNNTRSGSLMKNMQPISFSTKCTPKKRKIKVKTSNPPDIQVASCIPDLNGNVVDCVSSGNKTPDITSALPEGKVPKKRSRNKSTTALSDTNANNNNAYNIVGVSAPASTPLVQPLLPMDGLKTPAMPPLPVSTPQNGDPPDLLFMKRNLEMMTSTLEKAGSSLPPEMRTKLESEIKGFMKKINSMVCSSSST